MLSWNEGPDRKMTNDYRQSSEQEKTRMGRGAFYIALYFQAKYDMIYIVGDVLMVMRIAI